MFTTEPSPCCHHHPAEPLLLFHIVTTSTLSWKASRMRRRRRSRHNSGLASGGKHQVKKEKVSFPRVPFPYQRWLPRVPPRRLMPGTTAPSPQTGKADGGWRGPNLFRLPSIYFSPPSQRKPSAKLKLCRYLDALGLVTFSVHKTGTAVQHEPGSVPAASPAAGEM